MAAPPRSTPSPSETERRRFPRSHVALDVAFGPVASSGARPQDAQLDQTVSVNISLGGACLFSDIIYPVGTVLFCTVTVPGRAMPIDALGIVAWFQKVGQDGQGSKLGIEFTQLTPDNRSALEALLEHPPAAEPARSKRLLLVEDDDELRLALKLRFEASGFQVITAGDGLEALRKGREERPHLIILDIMLPHLNGFEVCRLLKFDHKFQHIPVVLFTARCRLEDIEMGRTVGADAYVTKPFSGKELIARVEELLGARRET